MAISGRELQQAAEAARLMLEELGFAQWSFSLEPHFEGPWELRLECSAPDGWRAYSFPVEPQELIRSLDDPQTRRRLLAEWGGRLACARPGQPPLEP